MKVIVTFGELIDTGNWEDYCEKHHLNEWCVAEGQAESSEETVLTREEAEGYGFLNKDIKHWSELGE